MNFEYLVPTKIIFGKGKFDQLGDIAKQYGNTALIVCGKKAMEECGYLNRAIESLKKAAVKVSVFNKISSNPKSDEINSAIEIVKNRPYDLIIGLGGGSPIDAAKAISVGINCSSIDQIIGKTLQDSHEKLPVIAIPTTAGAGAEVTRGAIITDIKNKLKSGIRGNVLFPVVSILDPELTLSLPKSVTAETGFDALTHAIESYVARKASPLTDMNAKKAMELIKNNLKSVLEDDTNFEKREGMSLAALLGGLNVATAGSCLPHRLQQAIGSMSDISHGRGLAAVYPTWLRHAYPYAKKRFDEIAKIFGGKSCTEAISNFMKKIGVYCRLSDLGAKEEDIDQFLKKVSGNLDNDPIEKVDGELIRSIYIESL